MKVCYFAHLRDDTGKDEEILEGSPSVMALLRLLADRYHEPLCSHILSDDGTRINENIFILVNGHHLRQRQDLDTILASTDTIAIIPVIEAG